MVTLTCKRTTGCMQSTENLEITKFKEPSVNQNDKSNNALLLLGIHTIFGILV
jgi:hypothetical protein